jgi:predicted ATPase/class 3 adenylate cyclase
VTFLFTDIEDSIGIARAHPPAWEALRARHEALLTRAIQTHGGHVFKRVGDALCAAFATAGEGLRAALAAQHALQNEPWSPARIRVRMGLHTGDAQPGVDATGASDYVGYEALARTQRIMAAAAGEQILVSAPCSLLVREHLRRESVLTALGRHRLEGFAEPEELYQAGAPGLRHEFPPPSTHVATPNNLPRPPTRFIGRAQELVECRRLLAHARLVTLTAIGGAGKTRLAIEVARSARSEHCDGVWFVDLAQVQHGDRVILATASALGLREQPGEPLLETLLRHLAARRALLLLDNCEQVLEASGELCVSLLERCEHLAILATSREGLGVPGEQLFALRSLRVPAGSDPESVGASEAVALFMDRARLANPGLDLDAETAPIVADICRRLDGIALAIELAAARARVLTLADIRTRLGDRFRLLTGGNRALPRQQTLLATLDWSYDHLTPAEQSLLRKLGVFVGGWTLAAATAVSDGDEFEVLDTLTRLADKSLVSMDRDPTRESRYHMVETVRQYALERLQRGGELDAVRERHARFFVGVAMSARELSERDPAWLARLDEDHDNVLAAAAACGLHDHLAEAGLRLVAGMEMYWGRRARFGLARQLCTDALARSGAPARTRARCEALNTLGRAEFFLGDYGASLAAWRDMLAMARELGDRELVALALQELVATHNARGEIDEARHRLDECFALGRELGGMHLYRARHMRAELARREGDFALAKQYYDDNLASAIETGTPLRIASNHLNLALLAAQLRDAPAMRQHLVKLTDLGLGENMVDAGREFVQLELYAALAALLADWPRAARLHGAAQAMARRAGFRAEPVDAIAFAPPIDGARAVLGERAFASAEVEGEAQSAAQALEEARTWLASLPYGQADGAAPPRSGP